MRKFLQLAVAVSLLAAAATTAHSQVLERFPSGNTILASRVAIACAVENYKVLVITNTSGTTIPANTWINADMVELDTGAHIPARFRGGALAPGAVSRDAGPGYGASCTAWYQRELLLAP